jgi:hypothetical protein
MELFDTSKYSIAASYDFEFEQSSSKKKGRARFIVDPAWDDGSAFPGISSKNQPPAQEEFLEEELDEQISSKNGFKVGSRLRLKHTNRVGIVLNISSGTGRLKWEEEEEDEREYDLCDTYFEKLPLQTEESDARERTALGDRWNPIHFGTDPSFKADDEQLTIFYDDSLEPPEPDDFKTIGEYEEAWQKWQDLHSSICAPGSVSGSRLQESNSDLNLSESRKSTVTAQTSSVSDTQESITTGVSSPLPRTVDMDSDQGQSTSSQPHHHASHSAFKGSGKEQLTNEIVSQQSSKSLPDTSPDLLQLKTSLPCSPAPTPLEIHECTVTTLEASLENQDTLSKGLSFQVVTLQLPSIEKDCYWLPSPTALSTRKSRPPGRSKLENFLKQKQLINKEEVVNPDFLESAYSLPIGWTDPQDERSAWEFLEEMERYAIADQPSEMHLTLESPALPSEESCTYNQSRSESTPEKFLEEKKKRSNRKGCLYKYLENKKLKDGTIASYPRVIGERDPDNPKHWRWGFNWEEKIDGEWEGRSIGSVPVGAIPMIQSMQKLGVPLEEIISFIRRSKAKK